jgi:hypothetical protein
MRLRPRSRSACETLPDRFSIRFDHRRAARWAALFHGQHGEKAGGETLEPRLSIALIEGFFRPHRIPVAIPPAELRKLREGDQLDHDDLLFELNAGTGYSSKFAS